MATFEKTNLDLKRNFIRGAARLMIADMTTPFPQRLSDIFRTAPGGTSEVQTATINGTPTGGTFRLLYKGYITAPLAYNASAAAVQTALELTSSVGTSGVAVTGSPGGPYTITMQNQLGQQASPLITSDSSGLTGGTTPLVTVVRTTPGFGQYDPAAGWQDLGATKGGVTVNRNNAEEAFSVDQIAADILALPTSWEMSVSASMSQNDIDMIQYLWEGGAISLDVSTGERTLPLGTPLVYRQKRLVVGFQRQSFDGGQTAGLIRAYCFRSTQRSPAESSITHNREGDQALIPFTWKALPDQNVTDVNARFGGVIDQA